MRMKEAPCLRRFRNTCFRTQAERSGPATKQERRPWKYATASTDRRRKAFQTQAIMAISSEQRPSSPRSELMALQVPNSRSDCVLEGCVLRSSLRSMSCALGTQGLRSRPSRSRTHCVLSHAFPRHLSPEPRKQADAVVHGVSPMLDVPRPASGVDRAGIVHAYRKLALRRSKGIRT